MFTFAIIFDGGFALPATCREVAAIINDESGIAVKGVSFREEAYVYACNSHVEREFKRNPYAQIVLPKLEDLDRTPVFHSRGFIPQRVSQRVFAAVSPEYAGILTDLKLVAQFLELTPLQSGIYEVANAVEAQHFINYYYLKFILPMSAYLTNAIPYCRDIPINVILQMPYIEWIKEHCMAPQQIPFTRCPSTKPLIKVVSRVPQNSNNLNFNVSL